MTDKPSWLGPHLRGEAETEEPPLLRLSLEGTDLRIEVEESGALLGRHSEADIRLPLGDVSRKHCRFLFREGNWLVLDLNSLNGTYVNEEQIHQVALRGGDILRVGSFRFLVEIGKETQTDLADRIFRITLRQGAGPELRRAG